MLKHDVLEAAALWYVELSCAPDDAQLACEHRRWLCADPAHQLAWERVALLRERLQRITPGLGAHTLNSALAHRRATLKVLGVLLMAGGIGWIGVREAPVRALLAGVRSGVGEQRQITLQDGTRVHLNTDSALNVRYDDRLRSLELVRGEISVSTAKDPGRRPFIVHTAYGSVQALGTRFVVREMDRRIQVSVQEHAVDVRPARLPDRPIRVAEGQGTRFDLEHVDSVSSSNGQEDAWTRGLLVLSHWRLEAFIAELSRYRHGYLGCARDVADLRLSGAFQLADTDAVLRNLSVTLPVRVRHLTRYWAQVERA